MSSYYTEDFLMHHGVLGQKWGQHREKVRAAKELNRYNVNAYNNGYHAIQYTKKYENSSKKLSKRLVDTVENPNKRTSKKLAKAIDKNTKYLSKVNEYTYRSQSVDNNKLASHLSKKDKAEQFTPKITDLSVKKYSDGYKTKWNYAYSKNKNLKIGSLDQKAIDDGRKLVSSQQMLMILQSQQAYQQMMMQQQMMMPGMF